VRSVANIRVLGRRGRPARGPRHHDVIGQTRTWDVPRSRCHSSPTTATT
jgi:hypothetical protein